MQAVILAGGFGTRLAEYTDLTPKPMVEIGGKPIVEHIMNYFSKYGFDDFILALGYRAECVRSHFSNIPLKNSDFSIDLRSGTITKLTDYCPPWKVTLIDTGLATMTGGRVKRLKNLLSDGPFLLTYGDGLSNVNLRDLVEFHKSHGKMVTITAVRPVARFGEVIIDETGLVKSFKEKPQLDQGWINGGFMVVEPDFLDFIDNDSTVLEREPLEYAASQGQLMSFRHEGFWQCMDTKRDKDYLESLWSNSDAPWA